MSVDAKVCAQSIGHCPGSSQAYDASVVDVESCEVSAGAVVLLSELDEVLGDSEDHLSQSWRVATAPEGRW